MKKIAALVMIAALLLLATSCEERTASESSQPATPADSVTDTADLAAPATALLDSGNVAFRAQDYAKAREYYARVTQLDSTLAAGWFGIYMVEDKLGNTAMAEYAMKRSKGEAR